MWLNPSLPEGLRGPSSSSWLYLFHAWDSGFYVSIARNGYYHPVYVFMPGYPALIRFAGLLTGDYWLGAFLVALVFSLASLIVFQLLAEEYVGENEALSTTLLMATFPCVALFTILAYSEAVFLFSSISTWYLYRKGKMFTASLCAALATLTKLYGFAILLPVLLDIVRSRSYRRLVYLAVPALAMASWLLFCLFATGDPLASWTDQAHFGAGFGLIQTLLLPVSVGRVNLPTFGPALLVMVSLFALMMTKLWGIDQLLWLYSMALFGLLMIFGSITSLPRLLAFIFPIYLTVRVRSSVAVALCMAFFVPVTLIMWLSVLRGFFIA